MHRYHWEAKLGPRLEQVAKRVQHLRRSRLPDAAQEGLRHWFRVQHAFHSNAIAGSRLTLPETRALLEGTTLLGKSFKEATEVANLAQALDFIESLASTRLSLGERDLRNLHAIVLGPLAPEGAGAYRSGPAPSRGGGLAPPEPSQLPERMREFSTWLASEKTEPPVVVACTALAWFDALHPFIDGNGRTGRLLASLLLLRHGYPLTGPRVKDRARYSNALKQAHGGDLTSLVGLTLDGLEQALARCEYLAREVEAPERPTPPRAQPPGPPDPREFPAWRRGAESLLEALEQVARQLTEKRSGASADLSLSLIPVEAPTPTSWERAWKGDVPLAVLFGQSPQGTFDATLRATLPPAFTLHVAGEASPPPERLAEVTLEEQRFTATSTTGQRQPGLTAEQLATAIWTHALDSALSRPR